YGIHKKLPASQKVLLGVVAATLALHGYLQVDYVQLAARNPLEFAALGGFVLLGWGLLLLQLRHWLGLAPRSCVEQCLLRLFAIGLFVTSAGLAFNGRYLDFPLILSWLPLVGLLISVLSIRQPEAASAQLQQTGIWFTVVMVLLAANLSVAVAMMEPGNLTAWWWTLVCGLALFVLPAKSMQVAHKATCD
ncbi:MAG: hypothetical protein ACT6QL_12370, partial [Methylophilus sp.]